MMPVSETVEGKLGSLQSWIVGGLAFIVVFSLTMTMIMLWQAYRFGEASAELRRTVSDQHSVLCAQKINTEESIASSKKYLEDVKAGRRQPVPGITETDIQQSLARQEKFLSAFSYLTDC